MPGRPGSCYTVSYRVGTQGVNTTPFCASTQALVPFTRHGFPKGRCPLLLLRTFSAHAKVVARDAKEMRNTQGTRTGFVSSKSIIYLSHIVITWEKILPISGHRP